MNAIKCANCGEKIEISEALKHQIEEEVLSAEKARHALELEEALKVAEEKSLKKIQKEFEYSIKKTQLEAEEEKNRREKLQEELEENTLKLREIRREKEEMRLEMAKKLADEEEKIRMETRKQAEEEHRLKDLEKEKKLQDALLKNEELRQKLEQGSQQLQGEVLELELERLLGVEFPQDHIKPVPKGVRGADIIQEVMDKNGRMCGMILWETKNAKWNEEWAIKLKQDERVVHANFSVIVSEQLPSDIATFAIRKGVWVTNRACFLGLAYVLRITIGQVFHANLASVGKNEKMEVMYSYLTGNGFKHRIEAIIESYTSQRTDLEKEKRWFQSKWARQEKDLEKIIESTVGMYGELQSVTGKALPDIKLLELDSGEFPEKSG